MMEGTGAPVSHDLDWSPMKDEKWPSLAHDPSWILEQIELGFRQIGSPLESPPAIPKMSREEIDDLVSRTLREELARLENLPPKSER